MSIDDGVIGRLTTQSGARTTAPMWARPLLTMGEWNVFTTLWSFANWNGGGVFPSHQAVANRGMCDRATVASAVKKFADLGLLTRTARERDNGSTESNDYQLIEVCPAHLAPRVAELLAAHRQEQQEKARTRRANDKSRRGGTPHSAPPTEGSEEGGVRHREYPRGTPQGVPPGTPHSAPFTYPETNPGSTNPEILPPPSTVTYSPPARTHGGEGEPDSKNSNDRGAVWQFAKETARARNWSVNAVLAAVSVARENRGLSEELTLAAARRCYADPATHSPGRLDAQGPWWAAPATTPERTPWCGSCSDPRLRRLSDDPDTGVVRVCLACNEGRQAGLIRQQRGLPALPCDPHFGRVETELAVVIELAGRRSA